MNMLEESGATSTRRHHDTIFGKALNGEESQERKVKLDRIAVMHSRLGGRGYSVKEDSAPYGNADFDSDSDFDPDKKGSL